MKSKILAITLTSLLATSVFAGNEINNINTDSVGKMATEYFIKHPAQMLKILQKVQESLQQRQFNEVKEVLLQNINMIYSNMPVMGNPKASKSVIFFYDPQCVYCHKQYPILKELTEKNKNVRVVFVPLQIFGNVSGYANKMSLYFNSLGKFNSFNDALVKENLIEGKLTNNYVNQLAVRLGANLVEAKKYIESNLTQNEIGKINSLQSQLKINGTPYMFALSTNTKNINVNNIDVLRGFSQMPQLTSAISSVEK